MGMSRMLKINTSFHLNFEYKKTPAIFKVTGVCKRIDICGVGVI